MKAAVITEPGKLAIQDVATPTIGDYDCLCETLYGSVCTGTDTHLIKMHEPFCDWIQLPAILGHESIGRVIKTGPKVCNFEVGNIITRVGAPGDEQVHAAWGGFAEFTLARDWQAMKSDGLPEQDWTAFRVNQVLPTDIDPAVGTMFITWRETLSYVNRIDVNPGDAVLVIGSGANGLAMANHAANAGASTIVMVGATGREEVASAVGCTAFINYKSPEARAEILAHSNSGFARAIDVIGTPSTANLAHSCVADHGTLGIYGMDAIAEIALSPDASFGSFTLYRGHYDEEETHDQVCQLVRTGKLNAANWLKLDQPFALQDIHQAFAEIEARTHVKPLIKIKN